MDEKKERTMRYLERIRKECQKIGDYASEIAKIHSGI